MPLLQDTELPEMIVADALCVIVTELMSNNVGSEVRPGERLEWPNEPANAGATRSARAAEAKPRVVRKLFMTFILLAPTRAWRAHEGPRPRRRAGRGNAEWNAS